MKKSKKKVKNTKNSKKQREIFTKGVLVFLGLAVLFALPTVIFAVLTNAVFSAKYKLSCFPAYIATAIIGICIILLISRQAKTQNLKKYAYIGFSVSAYLLVISLIGMYGYGGVILNESSIERNFLTIIFFSLVCLFYLIFKGSITDWLRRTKVSKHMKGIKNYWWLEELHQMYNLGPVYYLNKILSSVCAFFIAFAFLLCWFNFTKYISYAVFSVACILCVPATFFSTIQHNLEEHGKPFVLLAKNKRRGLDSVVFDLLVCMLPILLIYIEWILVNNH